MSASPHAARPTIAPPQEAPPRAGFLSSATKPRPFRRKELIDLFRGLASMLRAQITTADAIKYYAQDLPNKGMTASLLKIREDITAGISIHESFRRTGRFNDMTIGLIQAGSDAGQLHQALSSLAERLIREQHFSKAVRKATLMPAIIITLLITAFIFSQTHIVPQVESMLKGVNQKPEGITALAFMVSHFTQAAWPYLVLTGIVLAIVIWQSTTVQNLILGFAMSKWRLLRQLVMGLRQVTFLATIRLLHGNGINLSRAIRVAANSVKNTPFYRELHEAADKYEGSGVPLSTAFSKYTSVDNQVVHMLAIGERSASLDSQLEMLCEMYDEKVEIAMGVFTATVSFLVLLIAISLILFIFLGAILPVFLLGPKMMQSGMS